MLAFGGNNLPLWANAAAAMAFACAPACARAVLRLAKGVGQPLFHKTLPGQQGINPGHVDLAESIPAYLNGLFYAVATVACVEHAQKRKRGPVIVFHNHLNLADAFVAVFEPQSLACSQGKGGHGSVYQETPAICLKLLQNRQHLFAKGPGLIAHLAAAVHLHKHHIAMLIQTKTAMRLRRRRLA